MADRQGGWLSSARQVDAAGWTVLGSSFLLGLGYFMAVPLLTTYITIDLGRAVAVAGLLIGVMAVVQRGLSLLGGMAADAFGRRRIFFTGLLVRAAGFALMGAATDLGPLAAGAVIASIGGGLATPVVPAAVAVVATDATRPFLFATRQTTANVAAAGGPLIGAALLALGSNAAFWGAAGVHLAILFLAIRWLPPLDRSKTAGPALGQIFWRLVSNRTALQLLITLAVFWALQTQLLVSFPARAGIVSAGTAQHAAWLVSMMFLVNGTLFVVLQVALTRPVGRLPANLLLAVGGVLIAAGICLAMFARNPAVLIAAIVVFTIGEVFSLPGVELVVSTLAPPELLSSYFGLASVAAGIGTGLGSAAGGLLAGSNPLAASAGFAALATVLTFLSVRLRSGLTSPAPAST